MNMSYQPNKVINHVVFYVFLCVNTSVDASAFQSHKSIYQAAESFVRDRVESNSNQSKDIVVGTLDSRLKLKKCNKSLNAFMPKGSRILGNTTVGVKCAGSKPWSLHVPVTIKIYKKVLAATRALSKGEILAESDLKLIKHDISNLSYGYFEDIKVGAGMKVKRHVLADTVLTPSMLKKPQVITRGQKVSILAHSGRMQVRMMGKALSNGAIGDRIKVMNMKSRQKIEGVVTSSAEIKIDI